MEEKRCALKILVGKSDGKKPLGRPRRRWENNIKMNLQEVECGGMDWTDPGANLGLGRKGSCLGR